MKTSYIIVLVLVLKSCSNYQGKIHPTERTLTESVYSSVTIQPDSLYQAYATVSGILDANLVEEGTLILKNQELIQIINNTSRLNSQNAKFDLKLAKENYRGSYAM